MDGVGRPTSTWPPSGRRSSTTRPPPAWRSSRPRWSGPGTGWADAPAAPARRRCAGSARGPAGQAASGPVRRTPPRRRPTRSRRPASASSTTCAASGRSAWPAGLAMMALMYLPLPLDAMDVLAPALLVVATVIQFWAGGDFYRAAWAAARHGATNMNTLVAVGTTVAYALQRLRHPVARGWPSAGASPSTSTSRRPWSSSPWSCSGRWLEARAKKQTAGRDQGPDGPAGPDRPRPPRRRGSATSPSSRCGWATWCACARARRCRWTACVDGGALRRRREHAHRARACRWRRPRATRSSGPP